MENLNAVALRKEKRRSIIRRNIFIWGMLALPLIHFFVFFIYANFSSIFMSFQTSTGKWTLTNYINLWTDLTVKQGGHNKILEAVGYSFLLGANDVLLVLISLVLAYFIYKKIPGRNVFRIIFFLPSIIAMTVYVVCFKLILNPVYGVPGIKSAQWFMDGTIQNKILIPMYCLWVGTGYNILVLGGAMANVPGEVIENGKLEGVSRFRELFQIIIPMIWPTLVVAFVGSISVVFSLFIQVQLITEGALGTQTIAYLINSRLGETSKNYAAALGLVFTVISIPVVLSVKKLLDKIGKKWGY